MRLFGGWGFVVGNSVNAGSLRKKVRAEGDRLAYQEVRSGTRQVFNRSQILCPVRTGLLRATGSMSVRTTPIGPVGKVSYTARYAAAVNDGVAARIIRPRSKKVLRFVVKGRVVFAREVHQRSRRPRPFLTRAAQEIAAANGWTFRRV